MSVDIFGRQRRDPIAAPLFLNPLPAWLTYTESRPVITWTDEATGLRCAMRPTGAFTGGWCAYLKVAVGALRARPPAGVEVAYVEGFVGRNRGTLLGIVRGAFPGG